MSAVPVPPIAAPLGEVATDRLALRRSAPGDLGELAGVLAHDEVWRFPCGRGYTPVETAAFLDAQVAHRDAHGFGCWNARHRDDGRVIGYVGPSIPTFLPAVEVGWRFAPEAWERGYATEGATAALDEAFGTLGLTTVCSLPRADNPRPRTSPTASG